MRRSASTNRDCLDLGEEPSGVTVADGIRSVDFIKCLIGASEMLFSSNWPFWLVLA